MPRLHTIAFVSSAILLVLLPFHAFLWTWFHSFFWTDGWTIIVQSWKEILVVVIASCAKLRFFQEPKTINRLLTPSNLAAMALLLLSVAYALCGPGELLQKVYGLRTIALPLVAFMTIQFFDFSEQQRTLLVRLMVGSGMLVIGFALLQHFILPIDTLRHFGSSTITSTWLPGGNLPMYQVVSDTDLIRAQSTFAGPNQLAAYLLVVLPFILMKCANTVRAWNATKGLKLIQLLAAGCLLLATLTTIFFTYSRAAWIALGSMLLLLTFAWIHHHHARYAWRLTLALLAAKILLAVILFAQLPTNWESTLLRTASTNDHIGRTVQAFEVMTTHPLGLGLGSTAGISQRFDAQSHVGLTPENTYLGYALELGWLGGLLFVGFLSVLFWELSRTRNPLALSLAGLAVIALVLHPLEDAPTALTFFLLAGLSMRHHS